MIPITTAALAWLASVASASQSKPHDAGEFNWKTISPSRDLHFSSCYDEFQCARLLVPVDWLDEDEAVRHKTMAIAIIKLAANITNPEQTHGGTMIINPGGPSDSGIVELLRNGHYLQDMIDSDHKRFEVMSFDPRGMAFSTPRGDCFQSEAARSLYDSQMLGTEYGGVKDLSDKELAKEFALERALGLQCSLPGAHGYVVQAYMSTASVARDMLHMVDKLDELEKETTTIATPPKGAQKPLGTGSGVPRLQYLGTSYGTFLGNTFASMFPGRVKRMILDGNIVPEDWLTNVSIITALQLMDRILTNWSRIGPTTSQMLAPSSTTFTSRASMQSQSALFGVKTTNHGTTSRLKLQTFEIALMPSLSQSMANTLHQRSLWATMSPQL